MMANILDVSKAKYAEWLTSADWSNCKLGRRGYGQFLANYLAGEKDGFVLNLDGRWGTGKTEFLKRMYGEMLGRGHPVIYIDAWESDFSKEPLMVISSELLRQLEKLSDEGVKNCEGYQRAANLIGGILQGSIVGLSMFASKQITGEGEYGKTLAESVLGMEPIEVMTTLSEKHEEQVDSLKKIRSGLNKLATELEEKYSAKLPVIVLIDELDRCRPSYAVEMLEVVKHFFQTPNMVFMVATDTSQLAESIKVVYGAGFESKNYLRRFFSRSATLGLPDVLSYIMALAPDDRFDSYGSVGFTDMYMHRHVTYQQIVWKICFAFRLSLRDVDQVLAKIFAVLSQANFMSGVGGKRQFINFFMLVYFVVEHHVNDGFFVNKELNVVDVSVGSCEDSEFCGVDLVKWITTYFLMISIRKGIVTLNSGVDIEFFSIVSEDIKNEIESLKGVEKTRKFAEHANSVVELVNFDSGSLAKAVDGELPTKMGDRYWLFQDYKKMIELSGHLS